MNEHFRLDNELGRVAATEDAVYAFIVALDLMFELDEIDVSLLEDAC